jgi:hypothetical protein
VKKAEGKTQKVSSQEAENIRAKFNKLDSKVNQRFNKAFSKPANVSEGQFTPLNTSPIHDDKSSQRTNVRNKINNIRQKFGSRPNTQKSFSRLRANFSLRTESVTAALFSTRR